MFRIAHFLPSRPARTRFLQRELSTVGQYRGPKPDSPIFRVSEEVREAVHSKKPVVALETTIYTHGFPYPDNVALSSHLEATVRAHGGVPATVGVLDGACRVGMDPEEIRRLTDPEVRRTTLKLSRRDLGYICGLGLAGRKIHGGTTVAGTMVLAHLAGVKVFATGGLGGVHRDGENSMDVSADLTELGRTPIAVISSGCKSFLDIRRTLEYLETEGVGVVTFADGRGQGSAVDFPAFWTRDSGFQSPMVVENETEAAAVIYAQSSLSISSGLLFANSIPAEHSIPKETMEKAINAALQAAHDEGATGKDNTPFVLNKIKELTSGRTVLSNRALVEANVIRGTRVAVALSQLEKDGIAHPLRGLDYAIPSSLRGPETQMQLSSAGLSTQPPAGSSVPETDRADILVAGSLAIDSSCDYAPLAASPTSSPVLPQHHTSNPSIITQALGGVGHNVAYAAHLLGASVRLCSAVGNDFGGTAALSLMAQKGMEIVGTKVMGLETGSRTAQYVAVNDTNRSLVLAMADISILERVGANFEDDWKPVMERSRPRWLVVDANWEAGALRKWIIQARASRASVAFEPVSAAKATRLFTKEVPNLEALGVFPHHHVDLATPNAIELAAMHNSARQNEILERQDWWQLIDSLGISSGGARDKLVSATNAGLVDRGVPQQSIQLLPFVPCIVTKLGPEGVLLTQLLSPDDHRLNSPSAAPHILSRSHDGNEAVGGVYMRHFPSAEVVPDEDVVSVNGVGDTFMGVLVAGLARGTMHDLERLIEVAQRASVMTLKSKEGVHPDLGLLSAEVSRC